MKTKTIKTTLNQISLIKKTYDIVAENTGENFNVFQILGMETKEVKTHSKFLAELLNPKGTHYQGNKLLELFIRHLNNNERDKIKFDINSATVVVEKHIGPVTKDRGGRIDIFISDKMNNLICLENKINADERENQLLRYYNYGKDKGYDNFYILYLTLNGEDSVSIGKGKKYYKISYRKDIIHWLEDCKKESVSIPILREGITQYINLIKKLTNQTINIKMEKDIQDIISENLEESRLVYENYWKVCDKLKSEELKLIKTSINQQNNKITFKHLNKDRSDGFLIVLKKYEDIELAINIELDNDYYFFCLVKNEKRNFKNNDIQKELHSKIDIPMYTKGHTIGQSDSFVFNIDKDKYFFTEIDNRYKYEEFAIKVDEYYKLINS